MTGYLRPQQVGFVQPRRSARAGALKVGVAMIAMIGGSAAAKAQQLQPNEISDIVVTAQRRSERLLDVPLSIVSQTGDQLARSGVGDVKDLSYVVPGVKVDAATNYVQPAIRGVSSSVAGPNTEAPIAFYLDGVFQPNQLANSFSFFDVDRIEVAKGPQGTLFGRNATGGAISINTKSPSFTPSGKFALGYGNFNRFTANAFVTGPIAGDVLAASLAASYERRDSYDYDIARRLRPYGLKTYSLRGKLLFTPVDGVRLTLIGFHEYRFDSDAASGVAYRRNTTAAVDPLAIIATRPHTISFDLDSFSQIKRDAVTLRGEFDIGPGTLSTVSAYQKIDGRVEFDADRTNSATAGYAYRYRQPDKMHTEEISYASDKLGQFSFVLGAYYFKDNNRFDNNRIVTSQNPATDFYLSTSTPQKAYAGFGEINFDATDRLTVIGGIRYSWERRAIQGKASVGTPNLDSTPNRPGPVVTEKAWTPRASVRYELTERTNVYFTYSQGFKSGGAAGTSFLSPPSAWPSFIYRPEKITAYELGLKSSPTPTLSLDMAGYLYDYTDLQVQSQTTEGLSRVTNAATARIYGFDVGATWRATPALTLTAGGSVLHARYGTFLNQIVLRPLPPVNGQPIGNGNVTVPDSSGNIMPRAPSLSLSLVADYRKETSIGVVDFNLSGSYSSRVYFDSDERLSQPGYFLANGRVGWRPTDSRFRLELWMKNIFNKDYINSTSVQATDIVGYGPQRTFGATVGFEF